MIANPSDYEHGRAHRAPPAFIGVRSARRPGRSRGRWAHQQKLRHVAGVFVEPGACAQRWRALKRVFDLQITKTLPRRRTTLQSRWRGCADLRDDRTFMGIPWGGVAKEPGIIARCPSPLQSND